MIRASELLTVLGAGVSVMGLALAATLYVGGSPIKVSAGQQSAGQPSPQKQGQAEQESPPANEENRRAFALSDAVLPCRDHIPVSIPFNVRNVDVDTHSSRYDEQENAYVVHIDLEVKEKSGNFYNSHNYEAKITCRVSAADNRIVSFKVSKV